MAQETADARSQAGSTGIARVGKRAWGYDVEQVDAFLEQAHRLYEGEGAQLNQRDIQEASFDCAKGGYEIAQVDAALQRLERAVVDKQTTWEISRKGRVAWKADTEALYRLVVDHVDRAEGQRFAPGVRRRPSYDRRQVDRLVAQIADKAASVLGVDGIGLEDVSDLSDLDAAAVANAVFTQRKGAKGYDERQVDFFLNACVRLLSRLESYGRVRDYLSDPSGSPSPDLASVPSFAGDGQEDAGTSSPAPSAAPLANPPAASETTAIIDMPPASAGQAPAAAGFAGEPMAETFDELHQAERAIFAASSASAPSFAPIAKPVRRASTPVTPVPVREPAAPTTPVSPTPVPQSPARVPDLSAAPAPSATPEPVASPAPASESVAHEPADSSLAALAHMAAVSQEMPVVSAPSEANMPRLETPSLPQIDDDFPSLLGESRFNVDIPDLAFPTRFADNGAADGTDEKKEQ